MHSYTALYCIENANQLIVGYVSYLENAKTCPDFTPSKANNVSSGHFGGTASISSWVLIPSWDAVFLKKREKKEKKIQFNI